MQASLWNSAGAQEIERLIAEARLERKMAVMRADGELPATFVFRTREGGRGILKITGVTENPPGVKIRYKLVRTAASGNVIDSTTGLPVNSPGMEIRNQPKPPADPEIERAFAAQALSNTNEFLCRWVVSEDDTRSPVDILPDANDQTGRHKFRVLHEVIISSADVDSAGFSQYQSDRKELAVFLNPRGGEKFARATAENIGRQLAIVWRGRVIFAPVVQAAITGRRVSITGQFTEAEAQQLLDVLNQRQPVVAANAGLTTNNATGTDPLLAARVNRINQIRKTLLAARMYADTNHGAWPVKLADLGQSMELSFIEDVRPCWSIIALRPRCPRLKRRYCSKRSRWTRVASVLDLPMAMSSSSNKPTGCVRCARQRSDHSRSP